MDEAYLALNRHIFTPILERFHVPPEDRAYMMSFYISGLIAVINEWLKNDCKDPVEHIISVMQTCSLRTAIAVRRLRYIQSCKATAHFVGSNFFEKALDSPRLL